MRVVFSLPFRTTYDLNGHNFIEHQLRHGKVGFRKTDSAFVEVDAVLQAAADSPEIIRTRLDYLRPRLEMRGPHRNVSLSPQQVCRDSRRLLFVLRRCGSRKAIASLITRRELRWATMDLRRREELG